MNSTDLIEVSRTQLTEAHNTLRKEMDGFVEEVSKSLDSSQQGKPELSALIQSIPDPLADNSPVGHITTQQLREKEQLVKTVNQMQSEIYEATQKLASHPLVRLSQEAYLLHDFTAMWTIYQEAWQQRYSHQAKRTNTPKTIDAGDKIARNFYDVIKKQKLNLEQDHQSLIVVPFMSQLLAGGSVMPTPYIVAPRWGHGQIWTWLAYAHEVGHHIYRNVTGLSHELKVNLAMTLGSQKLDYSTQRIWFNWLDEIFADLFGLLQAGPAFIQTQQRVLLCLPPNILKLLVTNPHPEQGLLQAADNSHPIPYLRARLAIQALEKLIPDIQDAQLQETAAKQCWCLRDRWEALFADLDDKTKVFADAWRFNKKSVLTEKKKKSFEIEKMDRVGEKVLEVILNTNLYALGGDNQSPRTVKEVFGAILQDKEIENIEAARKAITEVDQKDKSLSDKVLEIILNYQQSQPFEIRHLLMAAQAMLEETPSNASGTALSVMIRPLFTAY